MFIWFNTGSLYLLFLSFFIFLLPFFFCCTDCDFDWQLWTTQLVINKQSLLVFFYSTGEDGRIVHENWTNFSYVQEMLLDRLGSYCAKISPCQSYGNDHSLKRHRINFKHSCNPITYIYIYIYIYRTINPIIVQSSPHFNYQYQCHI